MKKINDENNRSVICEIIAFFSRLPLYIIAINYNIAIIPIIAIIAIICIALNAIMKIIFLRLKSWKK